MRHKSLYWTGIGLVALGVLIIFGVFTPFPTTTTCIGISLGPYCIGFLQSVSSGNNFILGIITLGIGLFVWHRSKR